MSFPAYPAYKNSDIELLGEFPDHWMLKRFKNIFVERAERSTDGTEELLSVSAYFGIKPRSEILDEGDHLSRAESLEGYKVCRVGDLVINIMLAWNRGLGFSWQKGIVSPAYCVFYVTDGSSPKFLDYLVRSDESIRYFKTHSTGIMDSRLRLYPESFGRLFTAIPPAYEQVQIARFLDHETANIDALIDEQTRLIELLKEKRQAVISHAVTKGLDPMVPMKHSDVEWLGDVPAHWVCKSYRYAAVIYRGKFSHRPRNDPSLYDGEYAFIQTGDIARADKYIRDYKQTLNDKGAAVSQKFPAETLVMAIAANVGDTAILGFEAYAPDSVVGFKPEREIDLEFLRFSLIAALQELKKTSTQSTQANLNIDRISGIKSVFPSFVEQKEIANYLNGIMEQFSLLERQALTSIELMNERRAALISAAVTGKIDVRGWQPPASAPSPELAQEAV